jgi:hypothetical protein
MKTYYLTTTEVTGVGLENGWVNCTHKSRQAMIRHLTKSYKKGLRVKICVCVIYSNNHFYGRAEI